MSVKDTLLGMPHGTASNRLRKMILYGMLYGKVYDRNCFRCGKPMVSIDDLSIEHKEPWQSAIDPKAAFFDLENIAFSHVRCNVREYPPERTECSQGHPLAGDNVIQKARDERVCRKCNRDQVLANWHERGYAAQRRKRRMEDRLKVGQRSLKP